MIASVINLIKALITFWLAWGGHRTGTGRGTRLRGFGPGGLGGWQASRVLAWRALGFAALRLGFMISGLGFVSAKLGFEVWGVTGGAALHRGGVGLPSFGIGLRRFRAGLRHFWLRLRSRHDSDMLSGPFFGPDRKGTKGKNRQGKERI